MRSRYDLSLAQRYSFDAVDLAANRAGQLSPDQAVMFRNTVAMARRRPWRILVLLLVVIAATLGYMSAMGAPTDQLLLAGGATVAMCGVIMLISLLNLRQARVLEQPVVRVTEGLPVKSLSMTPDRWWMDVGGVRFSIDREDIDLFRDDTVYRLYHADLGVGTPGILSMEVLGRV